jgi:L-ascorbate metabolism protein UlaG (beta-lactamase superfamily)
MSDKVRPVETMNVRYLRASMTLLDWRGRRVLTDPWFARRMRGLPVFVRPALTPEELPRLDLVLVSHFHPDHFDRAALGRLAVPPRAIVGPPGLRERCRGVAAEQIVELGDGEQTDAGGFHIRAFAVEHSGYENAYLFAADGFPVFFGGDARYTEVFAAIGCEHRPVVALLPVGGTEVLGRRIVMSPSDAVCAAIDLGAKVLVPIHQGGEWMSVPPLSRHPGRAVAACEAAAGSALTVAPLAPGESVRVTPTGEIITERMPA